MKIKQSKKSTNKIKVILESADEIEDFHDIISVLANRLDPNLFNPRQRKIIRNLIEDKYGHRF